MTTSKISCLLFMLNLTSLCLTNESVTSSLKSKQKNASSEDLFLSFKSIKKLGESPNGEEIIDEVKELMPNMIYYLHIDEIPPWVNFVVFQAHAYLHNLTLGYNIAKVTHRYVTGQNVGLVQNVTASGLPQFFLENINPFNVTVLIAVIAYSKTVPVPGGCNMEFEVETAPWLVVNVSGPMVVVSSQPARPPRVVGLGNVCDMPSLHYQAYHRYLPEQDFTQAVYFDYVRSMISVAGVQQNGKKVKDSMLGQMKHVFSAYHGTGTVYTVIVTDNSQTAAAYVPALTYSCNPAFYTDSCQVLGSMFSRTLCALTLFLGLFVCLFGHSFFQTELFLFTTLMGSIFFYIVVFPLGLSDSTNVVLATVGGVTVANFWLVFWWALGSPLLSIIMATLSFSFLSTSILFYTLFVDLPPLESNGVYWLGFLCSMLAVAVLVTPQVTRVNLMSCALVGSYATIVPIDHYIGSNLKYIFINTMRRATVPGFNEAIIDPPFQTKDYVLLVAWAVLGVIGYTMQARRFADKPMFPRNDHAWLSPANSYANLPRINEQRPLLADINRHSASSPGSDSVFS